MRMSQTDFDRAFDPSNQRDVAGSFSPHYRSSPILYSFIAILPFTQTLSPNRGYGREESGRVHRRFPWRYQRYQRAGSREKEA
jgi:hypothetical protein